MKLSRVVYVVEDDYKDSWEIPTCPGYVYETLGMDGTPTTYESAELIPVWLTRIVRTVDLDLQLEPSYREYLGRIKKHVKLCALVNIEGDYTRLGFWREWKRPYTSTKTDTVRISLMGVRNNEKCNSAETAEFLHETQPDPGLLPGPQAGLYRFTRPV